MRHLNDSEHIVIENIELKGNAKLHRFFVNSTPYSAIYIGDKEVGSQERSREDSMIKWWNGQGWECFQLSTEKGGL